MVAEADESDGSFLKLWPTIAVVTNLDREHMEHFGTMDAFRTAFAAFIDRVPFYGAAVLGVDNPEVRALAAGASRRILTYGLSPDAEYRAMEITSAGLESSLPRPARRPAARAGPLAMPGRHNVVNSLAAVAVGLEFELPFAAVRDGLGKFGGVARRFDIRGEHGEVIVVDDYGHHPTEIAAVLTTARSTWPERRVIAVFQPHRYSRTRDLLARFGTAFAGAGQVIWRRSTPPGRKPIPGVSAAGLAAAIERGRGAGRPWRGILRRRVKFWPRGAPGDVVLTLGAGDVWRVGEAWLAGAGPPPPRHEDDRGTRDRTICTRRESRFRPRSSPARGRSAAEAPLARSPPSASAGPPISCSCRETRDGLEAAVGGRAPGRGAALARSAPDRICW